jgi:Zn-dependent peptidase ImmA (M78 family)
MRQVRRRGRRNAYPKGLSRERRNLLFVAKEAMILLSFRYRSDDQFWFTVFHEAGHLVLHDQRALFVENGGDITANEEQEANDFATSYLLPGDAKTQLGTMAVGREDIQLFAVRHQIARGIVVGQLQHMGRLEHGQLNWLKRRYPIEEVSAVSSLVD